MVAETIKLLFDADTSKAEGKLKGLKTMASGAIMMGGLKLAKDGLKDASDLTEAQNVLQKTLGKSGGAIDEMIKKSADLGQSHGELAESSAQYSAMLDGIGFSHKETAKMTEQLVRRGTDLGSFFNKSNEEVQTSMKAIISGETEPLKQFGVVMTQANLQEKARQMGFKKKMKDLSQEEQIRVRMKYVMDQTNRAKNDFEQSAPTSLANQMKKLNAEFINASSELMVKILPTIIKIVEWVGNNVDTVKAMGAAFLTWKLGKGFIDGINSVKSLSGAGGKNPVGTSGVGKGAKALGVAGGALAISQSGSKNDAWGWGTDIASGALAGASLGPWGAAIGGAIGAGLHGVKILMDGKETTHSVVKHSNHKVTNARVNH